MSEKNTRELPKLDISMKGYVPEFLALERRAHWIVTENVQSVFVTSSESVPAAIFLWGGLEHLHTRKIKIIQVEL